MVGAIAGERGDAGAAETAATLVHLAGRYAGRVLDDEGRLLDMDVEPCDAWSLAAAAAAEEDAAQDARAVAEVLEALIYEWLAQVRELSPIARPSWQLCWREAQPRKGRAAGLEGRF